MGRLHYPTPGLTQDLFDFDDTLLHHLQILITTKLRRREPFLLSWKPSGVHGAGRVAIWIDNNLPITFQFATSQEPFVDETLLERFIKEANSTSGITIPTEYLHPTLPDIVG